MRIVGTTYPNVILGQWVGANPNQDLARLYVVAFSDFINPTLKRAYESAGGRFVDVTAASGAYGSLDETTDRLAGYGTIPLPVAKVCELSLLLRVPRHPRAHERLQADRGADRQDAAAAMTAEVYELPEEHKDFRATIRQLARERVAPRAAEIDATDEYPWDIRRLLADQDVLALPFAEEYGGTGTGTLMLQVAVEELARASAACALDPDGPGARHAADRPLRLGRAQAALPAALRDAASGRRRSACPSPTPARTRPRCARAPCSTATSG